MCGDRRGGEVLTEGFFEEDLDVLAQLVGDREGAVESAVVGVGVDSGGGGGFGLGRRVHWGDLGG